MSTTSRRLSQRASRTAGVDPDGLDLATPSISFHVDDLEAMRATVVERGVHATDAGEHQGTRSFAFSDSEGRRLAVTQ